MPDPSKYQVTICTDTRTAIHDGLKRLARAVGHDQDAVRTIVDGLVQDVEEMRKREREMLAKVSDETDPKAAQGWQVLAAKYAEMAVQAQCKMLELGVKASNNEQLAIDRQMHIEVTAAARAPDWGKQNAANLEAVEQKRKEFLALRNDLARAKAAEFTVKERGG